MDLRTSDNPQRSRFEVYADDDLAGFADYRLNAGAMTITHTQTNQELQGKGVASALIRDTLDSARSRGLTVLPRCPFVSKFMQRHPEYVALVPEAERQRFGLT